MRKPATFVAAILFVAVAAAHAARLAFGVPVVIGGWPAPAWLSVVGVIVPGALAFYLWKERGEP